MTSRTEAGEALQNLQKAFSDKNEEIRVLKEAVEKHDDELKAALNEAQQANDNYLKLQATSDAKYEALSATFDQWKQVVRTHALQHPEPEWRAIITNLGDWSEVITIVDAIQKLDVDREFKEEIEFVGALRIKDVAEPSLMLALQIWHKLVHPDLLVREAEVNRFFHSLDTATHHQQDFCFAVLEQGLTMQAKLANPSTEKTTASSTASTADTTAKTTIASTKYSDWSTESSRAYLRLAIMLCKFYKNDRKRLHNLATHFVHMTFEPECCSCVSPLVEAMAILVKERLSGNENTNTLNMIITDLAREKNLNFEEDDRDFITVDKAADFEEEDFLVVADNDTLLVIGLSEPDIIVQVIPPHLFALQKKMLGWTLVVNHETKGRLFRMTFWTFICPELEDKIHQKMISAVHRWDYEGNKGFDWKGPHPADNS